MNLKSLALGLLICLSSLFPGQLSGQSNPVTDQWPQFRGSNCSGIATSDANPPINLTEQTLLWKIPLPIGHSSPCIWGDHIFVTAFIEDSAEIQIICIDRNTGDINWRRSLLPEEIEGYHPISNAAQTSPVTDGERVYVYFGSYGILCYSIDGELLWDYRIKVHEYHWGVASSPVLHDDKLIISRDIENELYLLALDKISGAILWKTSLPQGPYLPERTTNWSTPVIFKEEVILHRISEIAGYSLKDGKRNWWFTYLTAGVSTPIIGDDIIYIDTWHNKREKDFKGRYAGLKNFDNVLNYFDTNGDGLIQEKELPDTLFLYKYPELLSARRSATGTIKQFFGNYDKDKSEGIDQLEWQNTFYEISGTYFLEEGIIAIDPVQAGELSTENVLWRVIDKTSRKVWEVPSPVLYNAFVYKIKNGGILTCVDASSGVLKFRDKIGTSGAYFASPVAARGCIYFSSGNGKITVIGSGDQLDIVAQNDLDEKIYATPAIHGNTIFVRTEKHLFAFQ